MSAELFGDRGCEIRELSLRRRFWRWFRVVVLRRQRWSDWVMTYPSGETRKQLDDRIRKAFEKMEMSPLTEEHESAIYMSRSSHSTICGIGADMKADAAAD